MATASSWVREDGLTQEQQENRASLLHAARSGVCAKVTLRHAPDVSDFLAACRAPWFAGLDALAAGCLFALLAMSFAADTVFLVVRTGKKLVQEGGAWTRDAVSSMAKEVVSLPKAGQGKRDGRSSRFMGRFFFQAVTDSWDSCIGVFGRLGGMVLGHEAPGFCDLCETVKQLPLIGNYFAIRLVRLAALLRQDLRLSPVVVGANEWIVMKCMGAGPIAGFAALGIVSFEAAREMAFVLRRFLGGSHSSAKVRMLTVLDIPCLVCEWHGLLCKVPRSR